MHAINNGFDAAVDVGNSILNRTPLDPQSTPDNPSFSLAYWFKANPADCYGRFQTILGRGDSGWRSSIDNGGHLRWNPGNGPEIASAGNYNDGAWHRVIGVSDGTTAYLYIDGKLSTSGGSVGILVGEGLDLLIGGAPDYTTSENNNSFQRYFAGQLAQIAFFTNALTGPQVLSLYNAAGVLPSVSQQPQDITIGSGASGTLSANANGSGTLAYQWYQGATKLSDVANNLIGTTTSTLTITNATSLNGGNYTVVVSSSFGSTTSHVAVVTISLAPTILTQPAISEHHGISAATGVNYAMRCSRCHSLLVSMV